MSSETREEKEKFERRKKKPEEDKIKFQEKVKEKIEMGMQKTL